MTLNPTENVIYFLTPTVKTNFLISEEITLLATILYHKAFTSYYLNSFKMSVLLIFFKVGKNLSSLLAVIALLHRNRVKAWVTERLAHVDIAES